MLGQVDELGCLLCQLDGCIGNTLGGTQEGNDGTVMVGVGADIQQSNTGGGADFVHNRFHNLHISAFADVGDAFNNLSHGN